ncbi:MAG: flagellar basal body rod protein FlgF [Gammaproteobacteria bacterium]|nr:flagellar basal body rod protein FlgF [Gammaproteobacteria bacterium]
MDKMLFIAMNGAKQAMQAQATISDNLANISTVGFKASLDTFTNWHVEGPGYKTRVYNQFENQGTDMSAGNFVTTDRELDVAVRGEGWIGVRATNGEEAYTRAGDLRLDAVGRLTTGAGHPVMGNAGPIVIPPAQKIEIGADGSISIIPVGQTADTMAITDRIKLVNPDASKMQKGLDGLMWFVDGQQLKANPDAKVNLASGVLEHSNVNAVSELVELIQNSRQFETNVKLMRTAQENDEVSARLLRNS